jgi:ABC-2 type transport system permease protein
MTTMTATYARLELKRIARDRAGLFFIVGLPAFLYLIFGAAQEYASEPMRHGNVGFYVMTGMAAYGAVTATTGIGGMAAVERVQGWGRQLGLTPLNDAGYVAMKAITALAVAALPILLIFTLGWLTGAEATPRVWLLTGVILLVGAVTWSLFGLAVGCAFRSESAVSVASGAVVVLAFLGNLFFPLSGTLLTVAKFTPLYGYAALARRPVNEGHAVDNLGNAIPPDPLWLPALNVVLWTLAFAIIATLLVRRSRGRQ